MLVFPSWTFPPPWYCAVVHRFWIALLLLWLAAGVAAADGEREKRSSEFPAASTISTNDPVELEFQKLMQDDDAAQGEVDKWITDNDAFAAKGAGDPPAVLRRRIQQRFEPIGKAYREFLEKHPKHTRARAAYASFLSDTKDEDSAREQLELALSYDTNNPAVYNNLANIYGHTGPVKKAFEFYEKAIQLNPEESVYYHNFGTTVYLFRNDAMEQYGITKEQVFDKALMLYSNAMRLEPKDFPLASDVAQTYYGIEPMRVEPALRAWTNALSLAHDEIEREGVYLHFARIKLRANRFAEAHEHLNAVTNALYFELKKRLSRNLDDRENGARTNSTPTGKSESSK